MNPNWTPPQGLCASVAASGGESEARVTEALNGAQAGAQGPDPRDVLLNVISTTLNAAGYWLPIDGQHAIAEALLTAIAQQTDDWRRTAVNRAFAIGRLERTLELVAAAAHIDDAQDVTDWQRGYRACADRVLSVLQPKEQP